MKGKRKFFTVALLCAAAMAICFAIAACTTHVHSLYKEEGSTVWTETADGYTATMIIKCKECDYYEAKEVVASITDSVDPTETEDGYIKYEAIYEPNGYTFIATYTVTLPKTGTETSAESIALSATSVSLKAGEITTVTVTDTTVSDVTVSSANEACATAEVSGTTITITGVAEGSTTITVSCGDKTATINVSVTAKQTGGDEGEGEGSGSGTGEGTDEEETKPGYAISIDFSNYTNTGFNESGKPVSGTTKLDDNGYLILTDTAPEDVANRKATLNSTYLQTGGASSEALYLSMDLSDYLDETISVSISFASGTLSKNDNSERSLYVTTSSSKPSEDATYVLAYKTSAGTEYTETLMYSGEIASSVDENGIFYITWDASVYIYSIDITVGAGGNVITLQSVTITDQPGGSLSVGETVTLTYEALLSDGSSYNGVITWSSNNEDVATVDGSGKVTATGTGSAVITATGEYGGETVAGQCTIKVANASSGEGSEERTGSVEFKAVTTDTTNKTGSFSADATDNYITFTDNSVGNYGTSIKSTVDNDITYSDYAEVKDYNSRSIDITIAEGVASASITIYASHVNASASRTIYIATKSDDVSSALASETIDASKGEGEYLHVVTADNLSSGTYYIYTDGEAIDIYAVVVTYTLDSSSIVEGITYSAGYYESLALEAMVSSNSLSGITVEYKTAAASNAVYTEFTDTSLMSIANYTLRVDIVGLSAETYSVRIKDGGSTYAVDITVLAYDRSGYAHFNYTEGVGAYNDDGTLKAGALVIYLTESNKNDISDSAYVNGEKVDIKSFFDSSATCYSIGYFLNTCMYSSQSYNVGIKKACDQYGAVDIRVIGTVNAEDKNDCTKSLIEGLTQFVYSSVEKEDGYDKNKVSAESNGGSPGDNGRMARMVNAHDLTIEGIGEDACLWGWGVHFMSYETGATTKTGTSFEVRNLTFQNYAEDAIGMEGQQSNDEITASVERCWVHNNTFYSGYCAISADEEDNDKLDGDGSCDFKRGQYFTLSYNYFENCHKTNLFGANATCLQYNITMHHNWWNGCKARMPLVRSANVHYYNNYIKDASDTALSVRSGAYVFSEGNYFEGCNNVNYYSGTETLGVTKSYNDVYNTYKGSNFASIVTSRTETVQNSCSYGNTDYSSFDTDPTLFYYDEANKCSDVELLTSAEQAKTDCMNLSGANKRK